MGLITRPMPVQDYASRPAGFAWRKLGHVSLPQDDSTLPWFGEFTNASATLLLDDVLRVYFGCWSPIDADGRSVRRAGFVDLDRTNPTRVIRMGTQALLPLGGLGEFDEFGAGPVSVTEHESGYRAYYAGWTRCESVPFNAAIGVATSPDGTVFTREGCGPVLSFTPHEPFFLTDPQAKHIRDVWYLFYVAGRVWKLVGGQPVPVHKIRMATSRDGLTWARHEHDLVESLYEVDEVQASPDVFFANGAYHMFFSYRRSEQQAGVDGAYRLGYARSTDLIRWTRDDTAVASDVSGSVVVRNAHVFYADGRTYMAYAGAEPGPAGFGLAELDGELR
jgi:Glycosyl hydrolases family 32 N-terminal domain